MYPRVNLFKKLLKILAEFRQYLWSSQKIDGCIIEAPLNVAAVIDWDICFVCQDSLSLFLIYFIEEFPNLVPQNFLCCFLFSYEQFASFLTLLLYR